jgi:adenylate cyclase
VVSEILSKDEDPGLGGKELHGTVLFTDIKDFTTISERMSPRDLVALLNDYFSIATDVIQRHEGMLDKYLGDAIMALYGAPLTSEGHAVQACLSALQIQELVAHDNILNMEGRPKLITRIGLNSGPMVVGNVGSDRRLDFTAIGDTVNLASRLEGVNKIYGTRIVVSESTVKESQDRFIVRPLEILRVKGKGEPVAIFELIAEREKVLERDRVMAQRFRQGINWYRERSFKKALSVFQEILTQSPEDGPSQLYRDRCIECLSSPPPEDWDGVLTLHTK